MIRPRTRTAILLWIVFAIVVWNVIFDRVLVLAGRQYVYAAATAASRSRDYLLIRDWMPAATLRGIRLASAGALIVLLTGAAGIYVATRPKNK